MLQAENGLCQRNSSIQWHNLFRAYYEVQYLPIINIKAVVERPDHREP